MKEVQCPNCFVEFDPNYDPDKPSECAPDCVAASCSPDAEGSVATPVERRHSPVVTCDPRTAAAFVDRWASEARSSARQSLRLSEDQGFCESDREWFHYRAEQHELLATLVESLCQHGPSERSERSSERGVLLHRTEERAEGEISKKEGILKDHE